MNRNAKLLLLFSGLLFLNAIIAVSATVTQSNSSQNAGYQGCIRLTGDTYSCQQEYGSTILSSTPAYSLQGTFLAIGGAFLFAGALVVNKFYRD